MAVAALGAVEGAEAKALTQGAEFSPDIDSSEGLKILSDLGKNLSQAIGLADSIFKFVIKVRKRREQREDQKEDRFKLGIVFEDEDRDKLVREGKISSYFSTDNLRRLIKNGKLPPGWTPSYAVYQGFGRAIKKRQQQFAYQRMVDRINNQLRADRFSRDVSRGITQKMLADEIISAISGPQDLGDVLL